MDYIIVKFISVTKKYFNDYEGKVVAGDVLIVT